MAAALVAALVAAAGTASASPAEGIQPLSKIAVHKATVEIQPPAYVEATPALLGEQARIPTIILNSGLSHLAIDVQKRTIASWL